MSSTTSLAAAMLENLAKQQQQEQEEQQNQQQSNNSNTNSAPAPTTSDEFLQFLVNGRNTTYHRVCNRSLPSASQREGLLGHGSFGKVYHVRNSQGKDFAVKLIDYQKLQQQGNSRDVDRQKREIELAACTKLESPFLIHMEEVTSDPGAYYIVMELVRGGHDLSKELKLEPFFEEGQKVPRFPIQKARDIFWKVAVGVMTLHHNGVVHRDLKLANVLYERHTGRPMVCDFGFSHYFVEGDRHFSDVGTIDYADPWVITAPMNRQGYSATLADIWSLGCILHIMLTGYLPYPDGGSLVPPRQSGGQWTLKEPNYATPGHEAKRIFDTLPKDCQDLLKGMLNSNPEQRYNFDKITQNPWFRAGVVDIKQLNNIKVTPELLEMMMKIITEQKQKQAKQEEESGENNGAATTTTTANQISSATQSISGHQHEENVSKAINFNVAPRHGSKNVQLVFDGPVAQCRSYLYGAGGIFDYLEPRYGIYRNRMMTWEKVIVGQHHKNILCCFGTFEKKEDEAEEGNKKKKTIIQIHKQSGDIGLLRDLIIRIIQRFKNHAVVSDDSLVEDAITTANKEEASSSSTTQ